MKGSVSMLPVAACLLYAAHADALEVAGYSPTCLEPLSRVHIVTPVLDGETGLALLYMRL